MKIASPVLRKLCDRQSLAYIARALFDVFDAERSRCPCCGAMQAIPVAGKALVTRLNRCGDCAILYRTPTDRPDRSDNFYQDDYVSGGLTTSLPTTGQLRQLLDGEFRGSQKNFTQKIEILRHLGLGSGARILDFGASWGYATWQMRRAGFDAVGYEISEKRAAFGQRHLDLPIATRLEDLDGDFDAIFSSHVIEHFANPREAIAIGHNKLRPGGYFVAFAPNGSLTRLAQNPKRFNHSWGRLHPVYLDEEFYARNIVGGPFIYTSRDYGHWADCETLDGWDRNSQRIARLDGAEGLLIFAADGDANPVD